MLLIQRCRLISTFCTRVLGMGSRCSSLFYGMALGAGLIQLSLQWQVSLGDGDAAVGVWNTVITLSLCVGWWLRFNLPNRFIKPLTALAWLSYGVLIVTSPWILDAVLIRGLSHFSLPPSSSVPGIIRLGIMSTALGGVPAILCGFLGAGLTAGLDSRENPDTHPLAWGLVGFTVGILAVGVGLSLWLGPYGATISCLLPASTLLLIRAVGNRALTACNSVTGVDQQLDSLNRLSPPVLLHLLWWGSCWCLAGVSVRGVQQIAGMLWPATLELWLAPLAGLLGGGAWSAIRFNSRPRSLRINKSPAVIAVLLACVPAAFPELVHGVLIGNCLISDPTCQMCLRMMILIVLGGAISFVTTESAGARPTSLQLIRYLIPFTWLGLLIGGKGADFLTQMGLPYGRVISLAAIGWCGVAFCQNNFFPGQSPVNCLRWRALRNSLVPFVLVAAALGMGVVRCRPDLAQRLLFNSTVLNAAVGGSDFHFLLQLDEGRLVGSAGGNRGPVQAWRYAGSQWQIRAAGIPKGVLSQDPNLFPRHTTDTLQAILPLVLHPHPRDVLLLGLGSGETLDVALTFPLEKVHCSEADTGLASLLSELRRTGTQNPGWHDSKLEQWSEGPTWALARHAGNCDVILSLGDSPALLHDQPAFTREFYRSVAHRLAPDGIFCQRWTGIDYGPSALAVWLNTIRCVFTDMLLVQTSPGEYLCLATRSQTGLLKGRWERRLELPHVVARLAESGLDWSQVFHLPTIDLAGVVQLGAGAQGVVNSATSSLWPVVMPREMWRPASKVEENRQALESVTERLLSFHTDQAIQPDLKRRLAEVESQHDLMLRYPNQYWAYRRTLREQVEKNPRTQIRAATLDPKKKIHSEDLRRLGYFQALGLAIKTKVPEDIENLSAYRLPYDPMISYFVNLECAELYRFNPPVDPSLELTHRLRAIWFGAVRDASLRNILRTLEIARSEQLHHNSPEEQYDLLNALLQALYRRWEARVGIAPSSARELVREAGQTLQSIDATLDKMRTIAPAAGISLDQLHQRTAVLDSTLVRRVQIQRSSWLDQASAGTTDFEPDPGPASAMTPMGN